MNGSWQILPLSGTDLDELKILQPPDWSDIIPDISYYISSPFCFPVKVIINGVISGTGAAIIYGRTAWLAHIIVREEFRNRGIGLCLVNELLKITGKFHVSSCLLTATKMGKGIYEKAGFRSVSEYIFMNRSKPWKEKAPCPEIMEFREACRNDIYVLDRHVSGEDRTPLLSGFIEGTKVFLQNNKVMGYCLPQLKEGPIIAETPEAGVELMKIKYRTSDKAVVPEQNLRAYEFLKSNGFIETESKGTRMVLGADIPWQPIKIYSRAGGNFG